MGARNHPALTYHPPYPVCLATNQVRFRMEWADKYPRSTRPTKDEATEIIGTIEQDVRIFSPNKKCFVVLRRDNNLVVDAREVGGVEWSTGPHPGESMYCKMQIDGNLVIESNSLKKKKL